MTSIKFLDLFAGAGGLSLGFELALDDSGSKVFELFKAVEIDPIACNTLRSFHGPERVVEGDLTDVQVQKMVIEASKNEVDLVMGGIPCQSFSMLGPRSGYGKYNDDFKDDHRDSLYEIFINI